ncbi:S-adenosyl-L-methionine-dependent methyltransferase [Trametes versicolor FP-101664 SS1]|uniref:S-adenosyl-L-methionine-dependent methyltransferase n=1 Tax=Trametes versicolor (strain FP-101664) TaxID=717944 RepID=UPI0004621681|nr:S-adenosyl-L-methionine-dependent methyltransferase [Trametes versicolor FP-101664 SS1]EIW56376.1 S-adenosyl-L-methionine-dependent methyltransferase [Trametes versicolor FP-101664 SS1]
MDANDPSNDLSDDDGTNSDTSDDVVEVAPNEIPGYFQERGGRLFHSHGGCPYPLPVDAEEQQRLNGLSALVRRLIGDSSVGPVRDLLALAPGEQRRVVDLGTGTGQWVLDMAREFPHVRIYGVDIVPIATRYPPPNVTFEMHDIMTPLRYAAGSIDMVHARSITMAVRDYRALIQEASRVLRRGGLFVSCEWARSPAMEDGSDVRVRAPRACAFFDAVRETLRVRRGIECIAAHIPQLLVESRRFISVETRAFRVPVGDWPNEPDRKELGRDLRELMVLYARSVFPLLSEGPSARYAGALVEDYIREVRSVSGMVATCYTVHARRV